MDFGIKSNLIPRFSFYKSTPFKIRLAAVKYIINPVTSTIVATAGADAEAGSNLKRRKINGSIEPVMVPHITTPTTETATVAPIREYSAPYICSRQVQK